MRLVDVFNGDADGLCALHQLRLVEPRNAELVTGVKRDIALLRRVSPGPDLHATVRDVSLDQNRAALLALLESGAVVEYFDHHFAGEILNYNAYVDDEADLVVHPARLYGILHRHVDPFGVMQQEPLLRQLHGMRWHYLALAQAQPPHAVVRGGRVFVLPDAAWSRRARGAWGNQLAQDAPDLAHAVLVPAAGGAFVVTVRAPQRRMQGADVVCRQFPGGGGRAGAAGINLLPSWRCSTRSQTVHFDHCQGRGATQAYDAPMNSFAQCGHLVTGTRVVAVSRWLPVLLLVLLGSGCSSMLPTSRNASSSFRSFEDLQHAVESLQPMKSHQDDLVRLGIDPAQLPNTTILSYADVLRRFAPGTVAIKEDLDVGIQTCLAARDACRGWELSAAFIARVRTGDFLADFFNFRRRTETTGWRFNALVLMADRLVVYRAWGGQPLLNQLDVETNPLGPLQDIGPAVVNPL